MKLRAILLFAMILWDTSLHYTEILGKEASYILYIEFPLLGFISYNLFWTIFWTIGSIIMLTIMLTLLGSGVTVKHKTIIQNFPAPKEKETKNQIEEIKDEIKDENQEQHK